MWTGGGARQQQGALWRQVWGQKGAGAVWDREVGPDRSRIQMGIRGGARWE